MTGAGLRVAVSGASGFVGRQVVHALLQHGLAPTPWVRPGSSLPSAWGHLPVLRADLARPPADLWQRLGRPEVLIHLAWGGLPHYRSLHHFETELPQQYAALKQLVAQGLPHLVVAGTCFEYGPQSGPLAEHVDTRPDNPYGLAKDMLRKQLQCLQQQQPFELSWARLFYLHGAGQGGQSLYAQLQRAVAAGEPLFAMSGGEQLRDYLPVADAAQQLVQLALRPAGAGVVNLCAGQPVSVRRLVEGWIAEQGWSIRPDLGRHPYPSHEPLAFWGDNTKLQHCLADGLADPRPSRREAA